MNKEKKMGLAETIAVVLSILKIFELIDIGWLTIISLWVGINVVHHYLIVFIDQLIKRLERRKKWFGQKG